MPELPTGTVTFLFSDIEGSTRLLQACGDRWPAILARHGELLRAAFRRHDGHELGTEGDSFFVAFASAPAALAAAVEAQRALEAEPWPAEERIRARIGLHTGEATVSNGNYVGLDVHRAARIMSAGHGGQVLISASTEALVRGALPPDASITDLGEHQLRDLPAPERLYAVIAEGLLHSFPPPRSTAISVTNLPAELTSFIGREDEVARVLEALDQHRLVTLTGPGGTGKTRLAARLAREAAVSNPGGVFFVPLTDIREVELVLPTIGHVVGLPDPGRRPLERLAEHLAGRRALLVLDNLEQVIDAAPDLAELLARAPELSLLATSRSPLRIYGEFEFPVPPLQLPDPAGLVPGTDIERYPAVALFVERARAVRPDFTVTAENAAAVAEICWRLDGLPLAIELAAARVRILSPQAIVGRLDRSLDLGVSSARDRSERQQTLRGAIAWSHDLLDDTERRFFARLAVFRGSADLDAINAVAADDGGDLLDVVADLADKSLLRQSEAADGSVRFGMLETIREYAEERLDESDEEDAIRRRHAAHYLGLAEHRSEQLGGPDRKAALDAMGREHDNLRAAIDWSQASGEVEMALRFAIACWRYAQIRGYLPEAAERTRRTLELEGVERFPELLARAEEAAGGIRYWQGDFEGAGAHYTRALDLQRQHGDDAAVANALYNLAMADIIDAKPSESPIGPDALRYIDEALELYRRLGDRNGEANAMWAAMDAHIFELDAEGARELGRQCLAIFAEVGDRVMEAWTHYMLGLNENLSGMPAAAAAELRQALEYFVETEDRSGYALTFDGLAASAFHQGDLRLAARLAGAANAVQRSGGTHLARLNRMWSGFEPERLLSEPGLAAEYQAGARLEPEAMIALARSVPAG